MLRISCCVFPTARKDRKLGKKHALRTTKKSIELHDGKYILAKNSDDSKNMIENASPCAKVYKRKFEKYSHAKKRF